MGKLYVKVKTHDEDQINWISVEDMVVLENTGRKLKSPMAYFV